MMAVFALVFLLGSAKLPAQNNGTAPLHNSDIVTLVKGGLSDDAIIAVIRKSKSEFDLSPVALVALHQQGVSSRIVEAMATGPDTNANAPSANSTPASPLGGVPMPTEYGYYLLSENRLIPIHASPVRNVIGIAMRTGGPGWAVDGVRGQPDFKMKDSSLTLVFYQQNMDVQDVRYGAAVFVTSMTAGQFDGAGPTNPQFFPTIYGVNYNDGVPVNLWRPTQEIQMAVEPIVDKPGMFKVHVQQLLSPGTYLLFFKNMIHMNGTIFATTGESTFFAILFEVESNGEEAGGAAGDDSIPWTDPATGLQWVHADNDADLDFDQAVDYCKNLKLGGYSNWRLPEIDELKGISDSSANVPANRPDLVALHIPGVPGPAHIKNYMSLSGLEMSNTGKPPADLQTFDFWAGKVKPLKSNKRHPQIRALCVRNP
jgi:hypothetical protein